MRAAYELPSDTYSPKTPYFIGYATPASEIVGQIARIPPDRCIPVVFLPGIMGSNLKITNDDRITRLRRDPKQPESNLAWRPDFWTSAFATSRMRPDERQLLLDPTTTAVDLYKPETKEDTYEDRREGNARHANVVLPEGFHSSLLRDDPPRDDNVPRRTAVMKARERGWGEVYFASCGPLLTAIEQRLQRPLSNGQVSEHLKSIVGVDPKRWGLDAATPQPALREDELKATVRGTFFPAHAIGYNWLADNRDSAKAVAKRIQAVVDSYKARGFKCPGVILVTHSMGGLLGRAVVHPAIGSLQDLVLGVVHGVQPALGAAAAYKRMRAGFEDPGLLHPKSSMAAKVAGNYGDEVTAVLANSPGGLQLLPSKAYGDGWLRIQYYGRDIGRLPSKGGDPYEEIYKLRGKWYGLFPNEAWLNPAGLPPGKDFKSVPQQTHAYLDLARTFHKDLDGQYHAHTYAHYGADSRQQAFGDVTWEIGPGCTDTKDWQGWPIVANDRQGSLIFGRPTPPPTSRFPFGAPPRLDTGLTARLLPPDEAGDGTVPARSSDDQLRRGRCKAVFRQTGYDHQGSYEQQNTIDATLYCILRIAQRVQLCTAPRPDE